MAGKIKYVFITYLTVFLFQAIFTNLPQAITTFFVWIMSLFYIFYVKSTVPRPSKITVSKRFFALAISLTPIFFYHALIFYCSVTDSFKNNPSAYSFTAFYSSIIKILQFRGAWWENSGYLGVPYDHLYQVYNSFFVSLFSISIPILIFGSMCFFYPRTDARTKKKLFFWFFWSLFFLTLSSGVVFFPGFYRFMYDHIPFANVFREPWSKFMALFIFSFSALSIITLENLRKILIRKPVLQIFVIVLAVVTILRGYYFFSPNLFDGANRGWKKTFIRIPDYWYEYQNWTRTLTDEVILPIPFFRSVADRLYNWYPDEVGNSSLPIPFLLGESQVFEYKPEDKNSTLLFEMLSTKGCNLFSTSRVDFVLLQNDLNILNDKLHYSEQFENIRGCLEDSIYKSFGDKLFLYKVRLEYTLPQFTTPSPNVYYNSVPEGVIHDTGLNIGPRGVFLNGWLDDVKTAKIDLLRKSVYVIENEKKYFDIDKLTWNRGWATSSDTRIRPDTIIYKLVEIKDAISVWNNKDVLDKVDILTWLSYKKSVEIKTYKGLNLGKEMSGLESYLDRAIKLLFFYPTDSRDSEYWASLSKTLLYSRKIEDNLLSVKDQDIDVRNFVKLRTDFEKRVRDYSFASSIDTQYKFSVKDSGVYDLSLKNDFGLGKPEMGLEFKLINSATEDILFQDHADSLKENKYMLGSVNLLSNIPYRLEVRYNKNEYLVGNSDWRQVGILDSSTGVNDTAGVLINSFPRLTNNDLPYAIIADSLQKYGGRYFDMTGWNPSSSYAYDFIVSAENGVLNIVIVEQSNNYDYVNDKEVENSGIIFWGEFPTKTLGVNAPLVNKKISGFLRSSMNAKKILVYAFIDPSCCSDSSSSFLLKEFSFRLLIDPKLVLEQQTEVATPYINEASFVKINPTLYQVTVDANQENLGLLFNQRFSRYWKIYQKEGEIFNGFFYNCENKNIMKYFCQFQNIFKRPLDEIYHNSSINNLNYWNIKTGSLDGNHNSFIVFVEYVPQRWFLVSLALSFLGFIGSLVGLFVDLLKSNIPTNFHFNAKNRGK